MVVNEFIGEKEVLFSNTVIIPKDEQVLLKVDTENNLQFEVEVRFLNEMDGSKIESTTNQNKITITVHGIPSEMGSSPAKFIRIGTINGNPMWFYYIAYTMFKGEYIKLEYAFYEG